MRAKQILKNNKILVVAVLGYFILFIYNAELGLKAINGSKYYFIEMLEIIPAIFILTSLIQTWVPTEVIIKHFGHGSGIKGKVISFAIGSLSAGPIYAAFPICRTLLDKGANIENIIIILSTWAVIKVPMLINEVKFMGTKYMVVRWIFTVITILIMSYIMKLWVKKDEIKESEPLYSHIPVINNDICIGCGNCTREFPAIYAMSNGKAIVKENIYDRISTEVVQNSKKSCPVNAIN